MFTTLVNALKVKEIRMKLLFTFIMMLVIRFGSQLPVPGVNSEQFSCMVSGSDRRRIQFFLMHLQVVLLNECLYLH